MNEMNEPVRNAEPPPVQVAVHGGLVVATEEHADHKSFRLELVGDITGYLRGRLADIV